MICLFWLGQYYDLRESNKLTREEADKKTKISLFDFIKKHHSFVGAEAVFGSTEAKSAVISCCWYKKK